MDEFEELILDLFEEDEEEISEDDEIRLAEIFKTANRLVKLLEELRSYELKESASLMLIREIVGEDKLLLGLATKMLQDITYGSDEKPYVS
jgi:hypothetical protein